MTFNLFRRGEKIASERVNGVRELLLLGAPNVGKSTVFNALTGQMRHTGNWPGKTVDEGEGFFRRDGVVYSLIDLPGTYSLSADSPDERVARDALAEREGAVVLVLADPLRLSVGISLLIGARSMGRRAVLLLNLVDEGERKGVFVDCERLSRFLSVPVLRIGRRPRGRRERAELTDEILSAVLEAERELSEKFCIPECIEEAERIADEVTELSGDPSRRDIRIDRCLTGRICGIPAMCAVLFFCLWMTLCGANFLSSLLSDLFFSFYEPFRVLLRTIGVPIVAARALTDGVYMTAAFVVSVMLPPMALFFPFFSFLEESGYLPRIAYNLDRPMCACSLCGKQSLTMCMGLGCNAAGVMGCRIIEGERERNIAILTNSLIPCNGRLPTLLTVISLFFVKGNGLSGTLLSALWLSLLIIFAVVVTLGAGALLSRTILKGGRSHFALEMPSYRMPDIKAVILRSLFDKTLKLLARAAAVSAPAGLVIWLLGEIEIGDGSIIRHIANALDPIGRALCLDGSILTAFILGFPANETVLPVAAMIYAGEGTLASVGAEAIGSLMLENGISVWGGIAIAIFTLFHWPCSTTLLTVYGETRSKRLTLIAALLPTLIGVLMCLLLRGVYILYHICF